MPPKKRKSQFAAYSVAAANKSNTDEDSNEEDEEDVTTLWEQLQAKQRKKLQRLETATEKLQQEKETMEAAMGTPGTREEAAQGNDIITINAGGKIITALRNTLTIPTDSMWAYMFSGRWEDSLTRDSEGRIFLDYNHDLIEIIVDYLREKKIEDPSDPLTYPYVPPHKEQSFERMLHYFGLTDFFHPESDIRSITFSKTNIVQKNGDSLVTVTDDDTNKVKLVYNNTTSEHYCVACTTELDPSGDGVFWKVGLGKATHTSSCLFFGIVGNLDLRKAICNDTNAYGWSNYSKWVKGNDIRNGGIPYFGHVESLYFSLKANRLKMHRIEKNKTFVIDDIGTNDARKFYFHIGFYHVGTTVVLEPLDATERAVFD